MANKLHSMTPKEIVEALDKYIIGQAQAKRAVAIALRNRWRRLQVEGDMREEISPKNILLIGPTGVGKTEIARRLAKLSRAPFLKVEASKSYGGSACGFTFHPNSTVSFDNPISIR